VTPSSSNLAIDVRGLNKSFGDKHVVDDVTIQVEEGRICGFLGPNGSGKTTTLRILAGVLRPTGGDATVAGVSVRQDPEGVKHGIAYMSQRFGLYADLTVRENIHFYARLFQVPRRERDARMERLYGFSRLGAFADRLAGKLSGGMKQKLSLCCALIHQPEVLLLDEPTTGLDREAAGQVNDTLALVREQGLGVALVSHDYAALRRLADRVVQVKDHRIGYCGPAEGFA